MCLVRGDGESQLCDDQNFSLHPDKDQRAVVFYEHVCFLSRLSVSAQMVLCGRYLVVAVAKIIGEATLRGEFFEREAAAELLEVVRPREP